MDISYGTGRTVLTKPLVMQLADICGDIWRVITSANSDCGRTRDCLTALKMSDRPLRFKPHHGDFVRASH